MLTRGLERGMQLLYSYVRRSACMHLLMYREYRGSLPPDSSHYYTHSRSTAFACNAFAVTITADMGNLRVPKTFRQAMRSPQSEYWKAAIAKELGGLLAMHTWDNHSISTTRSRPLDLDLRRLPRRKTATLHKIKRTCAFPLTEQVENQEFCVSRVSPVESFEPPRLSHVNR